MEMQMWKEICPLNSLAKSEFLIQFVYPSDLFLFWKLHFQMAF